MCQNKPEYLSLTGENSHKLSIPIGQGSFSIGTKGISKGEYDVWVEKENRLNWEGFNECFTGYGKQHSENYPYGDWPRFFYYSGDDQGYIAWSSKRPIEDFHWSPQETAYADYTNAVIHNLFIHIGENKIEIVIGDRIQSLTLSGNLENVHIKQCTKVPYLYFAPTLPQKASQPYQLPYFNTLQKAAHVEFLNSPGCQALDCNSLLQFSDLICLNLAGDLAHLDMLSKLQNLERLGLRFVPNLTNMPKLTQWKKLISFIGYNIEETEGKRLRTELNNLRKEKDLDYSSVTKLRKAIWFTTEYEIPFSGWNKKNEKIATKAYKACLKLINKSNTEEEVHQAILQFIEVVNQLEGIETSEREDVGTAVSQLIETSEFGIPQKTGEQWFDEMRDF